MEYIYLILGIAIGAIVVYVLWAGRLRTRIALLQQQNEFLQTEVKKQAESNSKQLTAIQNQHNNRAEALKEQFANQLQSAERQYREALSQMRQQHEEQMKQQMLLIQEQMNTASEKILKERAEQLSTTNHEQLSTILNPLQTHIQQMREAVERSEREQTATMQRLDASIKTSFELSREVGERADKLAQALTGENKTQGNFGELRLRQLLEEMGLEEGVQFDLQETMRDADGNTIREEDGHRMIPDAILHFPDHRDVIIDSKMSFKAYEEYYHAQTEAERQDALHRHIMSMKSHVNELAKKNYSRYIQDNRGRLDFVLMYVFSESALQLALSQQPTLWKDAYEKGVVICGSQNLYMMLRVLVMTWRQVRQVENQQDIMRCADELVNRVQMFAERFGEAKRQLDKTSDAFLKLEQSTTDGGQGIITTARKLLNMGARENPKRKRSLSALPPCEAPNSHDEQGEKK